LVDNHYTSKTICYVVNFAID